MVGIYTLILLEIFEIAFGQTLIGFGIQTTANAPSVLETIGSMSSPVGLSVACVSFQ